MSTHLALKAGCSYDWNYVGLPMCLHIRKDAHLKSIQGEARRISKLLQQQGDMNIQQHNLTLRFGNACMFQR